MVISFVPSLITVPSALVSLRKPLLITLAPFLPTVCTIEKERVSDEELGPVWFVHERTWKVKYKWQRG